MGYPLYIPFHPFFKYRNAKQHKNYTKFGRHGVFYQQNYKYSNYSFIITDQKSKKLWVMLTYIENYLPNSPIGRHP